MLKLHTVHQNSLSTPSNAPNVHRHTLQSGHPATSSLPSCHILKMPRSAKTIELSRPVSADTHHLPSISVSTTAAHPERPKSKSLQPCRCRYEGCGKMFSKRSNLKAHMRVHSGVLPYRCHFPGCTKRFRWKSSLKPHIRVHISTGLVPTLTSSSSTALSSELPKDTNHPVYTQKTPEQRVQAAEQLFRGKALDLQGTVPAFEGNESRGQSPTSINSPAASSTFDDTKRQDYRQRIDFTSFNPLTKHPVARVLFQESQEQTKLTDEGEIDLSTDSVLSSSTTSCDTDVDSFSLHSLVEQGHDSSSDGSLTEQLWKSDIQVLDPFEEVSFVDAARNVEFPSGLDVRTGISASSMYGRQ